jgi:hypothetical protein
MTDKRKEALDDLELLAKEFELMAYTAAGAYPDQSKLYAITAGRLKKSIAALTQPQPVMGEDEIIEVINKAIADANIILKRSGDAATPIYRALKSSGIIKTDGGK